VLNVKKWMCWYLSIIELKNARWNIEIPDNILVYFKCIYTLISIINFQILVVAKNVYKQKPQRKLIHTCFVSNAPCNSEIEMFEIWSEEHNWLARMLRSVHVVLSFLCFNELIMTWTDRRTSCIKNRKTAASDPW